MTPNKPMTAPVFLGPGQHTISHRKIDRRVWQIANRLQSRGYIAYLVGGSVRDLLLGKAPKDYDMVTNARPSRIKKLFRNAFLVGRRFRLVHIRYGSEYIEVATFRKEADMPLPKKEGEKRPRHLRTYGTPCDDAGRRDFTVNGLFYDLKHRRVIDYVGGLRDLQRRRVVTITDPAASLTEDPVRMVRAARLAGRHGFTVDAKLRRLIKQRAAEVRSAPAARLLEELHVLLFYGSAAPSLRIAHELGLLAHLFPPFAMVYNDPQQAALMAAAATAVDASPREVGDALTWAYLLLPVMLQRLGVSLDDFYWKIPTGRVTAAIEKYFPTLVNYLPVSRAVRSRVADILVAQTRFIGPRRFRNPSRLRRRRGFADMRELFEFYVRTGQRGKDAQRQWE